MSDRPFIDFNSGYFERAKHVLPKQGVAFPWRMYQNYLLDAVSIRYSKIDDGTLQFE